MLNNNIRALWSSVRWIMIITNRAILSLHNYLMTHLIDSVHSFRVSVRSHWSVIIESLEFLATSSLYWRFRCKLFSCPKFQLPQIPFEGSKDENLDIFLSTGTSLLNGRIYLLRTYSMTGTLVRNFNRLYVILIGTLWIRYYYTCLQKRRWRLWEIKFLLKVIQLMKPRWA